MICRTIRRPLTPGDGVAALIDAKTWSGRAATKQEAKAASLASCSTRCYSGVVKTMPLSVRLDKELRLLLLEGARRTRFNQRELLRRTLRLYLREVIEQEALTSPSRLTNVTPWPRGALTRAYRRTEREWEPVEAAATAAQGPPSWTD